MKILKLKNNEKLLIPKKIKYKINKIFTKNTKIKLIKAIKKEEYIIFSYKNINKKDIQKLKKYKIIEKIKKKKNKIIIFIKFHTISYFKDNLKEKYNLNPNWKYFHKLKEKNKISKQKVKKIKIKEIEIKDNDKKYGKIKEIENLITKKEHKILLKQIKNQSKGKVPIDGKFVSLKKKEKIGAERSYIYSKKFAKILKKRILKILPKTIENKENKSIDYLGYKKWKLKEINPLLRIIEYKRYKKEYGGRLIPHYDYPYDKNNKERSLKTIVIYLKTTKSGKTRFLKDDVVERRKNKEIFLKNYEDKYYKPEKEEVIKEVSPKERKAIIFDHRLLHDAEEIKRKKDKKIIIFTDIIYERKKS